MAGSSAIFRSTNLGDTEASLGGTEKIEFNAGVVPDARSRQITSSWHATRDISIHPNPNKSLSSVQDGKLGTLEVIIAGYFINPALSGGANNLFNWMADPATNTDLKRGRFGIRVDDLIQVTLTPSASIGYVMYDVFVQRPENSENELGFIAKFYRTGAI